MLYWMEMPPDQALLLPLFDCVEIRPVSGSVTWVSFSFLSAIV